MNNPLPPSTTPHFPFAEPAFGTVTVVVSSLVAEGDELEGFVRCMSKDEVARQQRFLPPEVKRRFGVCRGRLRHLLGAMLDVEPERVQFDYNSTGKPRLASSHRSTLEFNVSHSGDWALFGFGQSMPVGVDTELFQRRTNFEALAPQVLSVQERARLELLAPAERNLAIMRAWVAKEALLKAIGVGIGYGLQSVEFPMPQPSICKPQKIDPMLLEKMEDDGSCRMNSWIDAETWRVHQLDALPEGFSAVACATSIKEVVIAKY
ncbi:MAG: 4'-phosphopantetheinyl transferase superfamily protein [Pirellulaceae bacterium]|nr:4'-phosphopantetheinyl transferase superfamily protein [Pirellulaceae bacterium]